MIAFPKRVELGSWLPWLVLLVLSAILQLFGAYPALRLDITAATASWLYQIFTCHLVHINTAHWLADSFALMVIAVLFHRDFSLRCWLLSLFISAVVIAASLLLFPHGLVSYAGLSGVLHGLFVTGALLLYQRRPQLARLLLVLLVIKLILEPTLVTHGLVHPGFRIAGAAHLYGCLGGMLAWIGCRIRRPPAAA